MTTKRHDEGYQPQKFEKPRAGYPALFATVDLDETGAVTGRRYQGRFQVRLERLRLALHEPQHRFVLAQIAGDFREHALLRTGQRIRQLSAQVAHQLAPAA